MWPLKKKHKHCWETTHVNKWFHPTKQVCSCGLERTFEWKDGFDDLIGMPWEIGQWVDSNQNTYNYSVLD